jgi:hypothetical protein
MRASVAALAVAAARVGRRGALDRPRIHAPGDVRGRLRRARLRRRGERAHARHREHRHGGDHGRHAAQSSQRAIAVGDVVADARARPSCRGGHATTFGTEGRWHLRIA